jgi:transcriptional regulator of met regulon
MKVEKVTVSVPFETFTAVERARRRLGKTRRAVVAEALADWLKGQAMPAADRKYVEAYLKTPDSVGVSEAVAAGAAADWNRWE